MDYSKLIELRSVKYQISRTCGLCQHGEFIDGEWGTCLVSGYSPLKHRQQGKKCKINKFGSCNKFRFDTKSYLQLGEFVEFLNRAADRT